MADHELHMRRAIEIAHGNPGAPFGCVIVDDASGEVVAEGLNDARRHPVLHGEMAALLNMPKGPGASRLTLYTTTEPCPMCSGAIFGAASCASCTEPR